MIFISFSSQHLFPSGCTEKEIRSTLKEQEDTVDKEKDRQALIDMFVELVKIDQENAMDYFLTVGGVDIPENTRLQFTKLGKVQVLAIVVLDGYTITEVGSTRKESVNNLALKVFFFFNYKYFHSTTVRNLMSIFPLHTTSTPFISLCSYYWNIKLLFNILRGVRHNGRLVFEYVLPKADLRN